MNADDIRDYIHNHPGEYLERDRSGRGYVCPICNSGTGVHGTGITTEDGIHFTCWSGACFSNADIIDIIAIQQGLEYENYIEKLKAAAAEYGLTLDPLENQKQYKSERKNSQKAIEPRTNSETNFLPAEKKLDDFTDFYREAAANIDKTTYHRGIPTEILKEYHVGYIESWRHPKNTKAPFSPRLIIPNSRHSYTARDTRDNLTEEQEPYKKQKVGSPQCIFNLKALTNEDEGKYVIVVEGEIDALSVIAVGGQAIALGSTAMVKTFLRELEDIKEHGKKCKKLILALDTDDAGAKATEQLKEGLNRLKLKENKDYFTYDITGSYYKDANAAYTGNKERFTRKVKEAMNIEATMYKQQKSDTLYIDKYLEEIKNSGETDFYPTGFSSLDKELDGGLYPGLYIIGGISSVGKTTFCMQIADAIAAAGHDILICSLEMAKKELMAKRLSRLTYKIATNSGQSTRLAKTTRGLLTGARFKLYSSDEMHLINAAISEYKKNGANNTYTIEGTGNITATKIRNAVEQHVKYTGTTPVILVDYLQMLAPEDPRATDKQSTDKAVLELKRISRDYNTPVITISSFNRTNYHNSADMEAFKESGGIEYSSDILIALEYQGTGKENFNFKAAKAADPRKILLKILKNRNGAAEAEINYNYYKLFNYFEET